MLVFVLRRTVLALLMKLKYFSAFTWRVKLHSTLRFSPFVLQSKLNTYTKQFDSSIIRYYTIHLY